MSFNGQTGKRSVVVGAATGCLAYVSLASKDVIDFYVVDFVRNTARVRAGKMSHY